MKDLLQKSLKQWIFPVIVLLAVNYTYFYPVLTGKVIAQDDIMMGIAKGKEIRDYRAATGEEALWTNSMFSGMPAFQISTEYPNNWLSAAQAVIITIGGSPSSIYIIAALMIGFYFLLLSFNVNPWLSAIGAVSFGFSAFFIISLAAGHNSKIRTAAYMAPLIMGVILTYRNKLLLGFALTALFLGLSIKSGHYQITFYTGIVVLCVMGAYTWQAFKEKTFGTLLKQTAVLAIAAVMAIGPNVGSLWSTYSYTKETMRGGSSELTSKEESKGGLDFEYAMSWSYGIGETLNLVIPNLMGGGAKQDYQGTDTYDFLVRTFQGQGASKKQAESQANQYTGAFMYWGKQSLVNGGYYLGAVIFFFFVFGLLVVKGVTRNWAVAAMVLGLFIAWGEHFEFFNRFLFDHLPLFNKFRVPSMALVILLIIVPFIGILGLDKLLKGVEGKKYFEDKLKLAFYISGGIALAIALFGPFIFNFAGGRDDGLIEQGFDIDMLIGDRESLLRKSAFTTFAFVLVTAITLWLYNAKKLKLAGMLGILAFLTIFDLWMFDKDQLGENEFISEREYDKQFSPTQADAIILKDTDIHYRVFNSTVSLTSDSYTSYYHKSIGGYHGAKLMRYQDLIENQLAKSNMACYNMLNTKWFLVQGDKGAPLQATPNMQACGNAWAIDTIVWAANADAEMAAMDNFNPQREVIIDERYKTYVGDLQPNSAGSEINLTKYDPKEMTYNATISGAEQLVVFSELFYEAPGQKWKAYVDGNETEYIRVNYLLRGMKLPTGQHDIVFKFEPETYFVGEKIDLVFSILLFLSLVGAIILEVRNASKKEEVLDSDLKK